MNSERLVFELRNKLSGCKTPGKGKFDIALEYISALEWRIERLCAENKKLENNVDSAKYMALGELANRAETENALRSLREQYVKMEENYKEELKRVKRDIWERVRVEKASPELDAAKQFLTGLLANGVMKAQSVKASAKHAGHSWRTVQRAKGDLGVSSYKGRGADTAWYWEYGALGTHGALGALACGNMSYIHCGSKTDGMGRRL